MKCFALVSFLLVGCAVEPHQVTPAPANPNFTLFVSNQSFEIDRVGIQVDFEGELAVTGDFDVEGQHSWHEFTFALTPDVDITLEARAHGDVLQATVKVDDAHDYAVINFWSADDSSASPYLDLTLFDDAPTFE
ncbi:MAG: hypothetical protein H0V17_26005 [Deltaproteobacteria bacterium]|nr:hypothetical protein [Deltaproteobacteria bacterium]